MKRLILTLLLVLMPATIYAAEIHGHFQYGYDYKNDSFKTDTEIVLSFHLLVDLEIYGGQTVLFVRDRQHGKPYRDIYTIGYTARIKPFYINLEHYCSHRVLPSSYLYRDIMPGDPTVISVGVEW